MLRKRWPQPAQHDVVVVAAAAVVVVVVVVVAAAVVVVAVGVAVAVAVVVAGHPLLLNSCWQPIGMTRDWRPSPLSRRI